MFVDTTTSRTRMFTCTHMTLPIDRMRRAHACASVDNMVRSHEGMRCVHMRRRTHGGSCGVDASTCLAMHNICTW